jgi:hypothetical protein
MAPAWFVWFSLAACGAPSISAIEICALDLSLAASTAAPGDVLTVTGGPLTELRDTIVTVGGIQAEVSEVARSEECSDSIVGCDVCRVEAECPPCGFCPLDVDAARAMGAERLETCFGDPLADPPVEGSCDLCVETVTFTVPADLPPGPTSVVVFNAEGQSSALPLDIVAATTTGTGS